MKKAKQLTFTLGLKQVVRFLEGPDEKVWMKMVIIRENLHIQRANPDCSVASQNSY
jgi:hypothetical protein